jgi:O-antigen ligase
MMSILGGLALETRTRKHRIGLCILVALLAVPFLYTLSRSSWLAAAGAAVVLLAVTRERKRLLAFLAVAAVLAVLFMPAEVTERTAYTFEEQRGSMKVGDLSLDPSSSARLRSWGETMRDAARHPLLGHGVTGYHFLDAQYFRILAETGIVGLAAFAFLILLLARHARTASKYQSDPLLRGLTAGFLAALGGLLVHGLGANTFIIVRIMEPFWLFAGLVMVAPLLDESESPDPSPRQGGAVARAKGLDHGAA